jgi:predicted phage tail protein
MTVSDFMIVALLSVGFFWIVGKLFIKVFKFVLITAIGAAVVAAVVLSPIWLAYAAGVALYGTYALLSPPRGDDARTEADEDKDES